MSCEEFIQSAADFPEPFRLVLRDSVESTNDEVRKLGQAGAPDGLVLLAEIQTAGRGRRGAAWFSPPGESLAFSILLRPEEPKALWPRLALAAGLAVAETVESFGPQAGIKWPNDVWIGQQKVAGILVEAVQDFAVVGIGLNVNSISFPPEVTQIATSLRIETTQVHSRGEILGKIINNFAGRRCQIANEFDLIIHAVRRRSVLTGKHVALTTASERRIGIVEGIGDGGELLFRTATGLERLLQADEIRLR